MKKEIVYIGNFRVSQMDAETQLVLGNSNILRDLGYKVTLIGNDPACTERLVNISGFDCYNLSFSKNLKGLISSKDLFSKTLEIINTIGAENIFAILCYGSLAFAVQLDYLSRWARKNGVKIIYNCVDLPHMSHGTLIQRIVKKLDRTYLNHCIAVKMDGLIAVSSYIKKYFEHQSKYPIVIIPPLKDVNQVTSDIYRRNLNKRIVYVGCPFPTDGRAVDENSYKDRLDLFIDLFINVLDRVPPCSLDIYGLSKEQYLGVVKRHIGVLSNCPNVVFHGRVKHEEILSIVSAADYSLVYRVKNKMTMAGFSTKFVESISYGTPVILTETSEYRRYVDLDVAACVLDPDEKNQADKLVEFLNEDQDMMIKRRKACVDSKAFDYRKYVDSMKEFLRHVMEG